MHRSTYKPDNNYKVYRHQRHLPCRTCGEVSAGSSGNGEPVKAERHGDRSACMKVNVFRPRMIRRGGSVFAMRFTRVVQAIEGVSGLLPGNIVPVASEAFRVFSTRGFFSWGVGIVVFVLYFSLVVERVSSASCLRDSRTSQFVHGFGNAANQVGGGADWHAGRG